jgi:hypothetical protein
VLTRVLVRLLSRFGQSSVYEAGHVGRLNAPDMSGMPGTPGTIRIHDEGLPMPFTGVWGAAIGEEVIRSGTGESRLVLAS